MKATLLRVYVALLAAANRLYEPDGPEEQAADAYMTLVGYFNSLRELGGMRRLVEDEVRTRCDKAEDRKPEGCDGAAPLVPRPQGGAGAGGADQPRGRGERQERQGPPRPPLPAPRARRRACWRAT